MSTEGMQLRSFTLNGRLKVIREVEENGNCIVFRKFIVSVSCIRDLRSKIYCYKEVEAKELFMDKKQSFQK